MDFYETYHFMSTTTGELQPNLKEVIKATLFNLRHYHFMTFWKYSKTGF